MKAIMVMFDSLNRNILPPYGCEWVHAPNFTRLAAKTVTFDRCYVGSMPCIPARRELHTGRYNFLHRSWGPIEPFDDSMPEILKNAGVYTHLTTDHCHYFEEGGATYHTRYSSWEFNRGREGDPWKGELEEPPKPELHPGQLDRPGFSKTRFDWVNRKHLQTPEDQPQYLTFSQGIEFMTVNRNCDNWFLQIETFDPHEPFFAPEKYKRLYEEDYQGKFYDWPKYAKVEESEVDVEHIKKQYAALVSMCDENLGRVLDAMDELDLWRDTMLIVCTDHGYSLADNGWWAKNSMPWYNAIANTPLFIWDPRCGKANVRNSQLVQMIDFAPTLLYCFGLTPPADMTGKDLQDCIANGNPVRDYALFGLYGSHVNITDGKHVYMRAPVTPDNQPLYEYTLMPAHIHRTFDVAELTNMELAKAFSFTKGCGVLKIKGGAPLGTGKYRHLWQTELYDIEADYQQENPIFDRELEAGMVKKLIKAMRENDAPGEQYTRLGLNE
jgi:arylsulfatase A-like enzyme